MELRLLVERSSVFNDVIGKYEDFTSEPRLQYSVVINRFDVSSGKMEPYTEINWIDVPTVHVDI